MVASRVPPTRDLARNPGVCPDWESNWPPFGLQAGTQSTEPHQPGQKKYILNSFTEVSLVYKDLDITNMYSILIELICKNP